MTDNRTRSYVFTINNYTEEDEHQCWALAYEFGGIKYIVVGKEIGEGGTPHLQGYVHFKNKISLKQLSDFLPRGRLAVRHGTHKQASDYCKKDGDYWEWGTLPVDDCGAAGRDSMEALMSETMECIRQGDYLSIPMAATHFIKAAEYRFLKEQEQNRDLSTMDYTDEDTPHEWIWGCTGTGKSKYVDELKKAGASVYKKTRNKWWNGYINQEIVHIDEMGPKQVEMGSNLKEWVDRYAFNAETKGGMMMIRPKKIIVTSNYRIEEVFPDPADHLPLKRKFKVRHFLGTLGVDFMQVDNS